MINQPDKAIINALVQLDGNLHFEIVKDWLRNTLVELQASCAYSKDEVQTRWNQGAQQVLIEFLEKSDKAQETIRKFSP